MNVLSKVVWSEGMYLAPHHFQVQSRYFEDALHFATSSMLPWAYGLAGCAIDEDALRNGTLSLTHARGIFPDGLLFDMPECDALPPPRPLADLFPPTREGVVVRLEVPPRKTGGVNCAAAAETGARYRSVERTIPDESTGSDERPVRLGEKNIRLMLDTEEGDGAVSLPLARIVRDGTGHFVLDAAFIPPCVQIAASERLMLLLRRLIEILEEKSDSLSRAAGGSKSAFSAQGIAYFWLLHAVNSALGVLRHLWIAKRGHPEEVFLELSRLGGALCTFVVDSHPRMLPLYDHARLGECFDALDQHIRRHLNVVLPLNCITIELTRTADYFYQGTITDPRCLGSSRWVFGVESGIGEVELITKVPTLVKVCSGKFIGELVKRALPGLSLTHLPVPPSSVPARVESQYFGITRTGPFWDHIAQTRQIGIYVPGEVPDPKLELFVILDS